MSFDTTFEFDPIITGVTQKILEIESLKTLNEIKVASLTNSPYLNLLTIEINLLNTSISDASEAIIGYNAILTEIYRIKELSQQEKGLIYYFYTILGVPKNKYMIKMLFNTEALNNPNVLTLYSDTTTPPEVKLLVAKILYNQFTVHGTYKEIFNIGAFLS